MSQQFCLKWNNHMNNMMDVFKNLLSTEAMVDVTLACDGLSLKAHKIVLSACSPFFQSLFLENPCKHPIVILKDMKYTELKAIIEFMYHGEVNVAQDQLSALMKTAETLRVKGLAEVTNEKNQSGDESSHRSVSRTDTPPPKRRRGRTRKRSLSDQSDDGASEPKIKQPDSDIEELSGDMDPSTPYSTASTVPLQSHSTNSFHKSQQDQPVEQGADESFAPEEKFGVEPSKLLEQTLTTDDLPRRSGRSSVQSNMELQRRPRSSTDHSTSLVPVTSTPMSSDALVVANQQPESPPDIKPELLDLEPPMSPVAGPSHSTDENSMMMYMDQSSMSTMPGPSGYQDNSALVSTDSQPQATYYTNFCKIDVSKPDDKYKRILYMCSDCNYICGTEELNNHRNKCTRGNAASGGSRSILKVKQKVPAKSNASPGGNQDNPKVKKKVSSKSIAAPDGDQGDPNVKKTVPPKSIAAPDGDQGNPKVKKTVPPKIPPQKSPIRNDDDEETVSTAGSHFEEQSDMLTEEIDNTTASFLEGQSVTLTCEASGETAAPDEDQDIIKVKETVPSKNNETSFSEIDTSKPDNKVKRILYMCSDCRYICGSLLSVKNHKKTCTGEKMPSSKELPADLKTSMYVCPLCDFYCPSETRMKLHYKFCNGGKVSIACQTGDNSQSTSGPTRSSVILSPRPFSGSIEDDTEDAPLPEGKMSAECQTDPVTIKTVKTNCDYCDYSTARPGNLQKHMKIHTGEKNFLCPYCARRFREKSTLKIHERTHTGARPYVCDICEKTFASLASWNKHKIRLHTVERPFVCDYCRMGFKFKYDLRCHIRTHSSKIFPGKQYKKVQ